MAKEKNKKSEESPIKFLKEMLGMLLMLVGAVALYGLMFYVPFYSGGSPNNSGTSPSEDIIDELENDIDDEYSELVDQIELRISETENFCDWINEEYSHETAMYCIETLRSVGVSQSLRNWSSSRVSYDKSLSLKDRMEIIVDEANRQYNRQLNRDILASSEMGNYCSWLYENYGSEAFDYCEEASLLHSGFYKDPFSTRDY